MLVREVMSPSVVTLTPDETLLDAINRLRSNHIRHLPVIDASTLVGIVTDRDVKRATPSVLSGNQEEYNRVIATTRVAQFMTRDPLTVTPATNLKAAIELFIDRKIGAIPVVEGGRLVGILSDLDILRVARDLLGRVDGPTGAR
jgi:acetoin utilization protein AcuB